MFTFSCSIKLLHKKREKGGLYLTLALYVTKTDVETVIANCHCQCSMLHEILS